MAVPPPWWNALRLPYGSGAQGSTEKSRRESILAIAGVVLLGLLSLSQTSGWRLAEARIFDYFSTISAPQRSSNGPIIVAIDEPSLAEIGLQWPWPRDLHARLVEALRAAGAKAIGLDIIFAEPTNEEADAALAAVLGPDVVLAADETLIETPQADQLIRVEPLAEFTETGAKPGIATIALEGDGTFRRIPFYPDGFARRLIENAGMDAPAAPPGALLQSFGPVRTYPTVSYYQTLDPEQFLPEGIFRDRVVIVGLSLQNAPTTDAGGADAYATPYTVRTGRLVSGAEIQATIFDNLAAGLFIAPANEAAIAAALLIAVLLAIRAVWRGTGWRTVAAGFAAVALAVAGSFLLLRFGRIFLSPLAPSLAFVLVAAAQGARDYAAERRLRHGITRAFSQYLSPVLVERLASDPSQLKLGGERRTLSVLFCDVRGFTTIAEGMKDDPERLTRLVNRLLNPLSQIVLAEGGTIDKYMGDAIMAFWNAPLDDPDHATNAVRAGLKMLSALETLNAELAAEHDGEDGPTQLAIGIGINTGDCIVGNMGSDMRFDYSAIGDAVNLASRLEGKTRDYDVPLLLGPETARLAGEHYPVVELDRITVKGKNEIVPVATVLFAAGSEMLAQHAALLDDLYGGRLFAPDQRLDTLAAALPFLAGYYRHIASRLLPRAAAAE